VKSFAEPSSAAMSIAPNSSDLILGDAPAIAWT
jgi:hypothetical protein